MRKISRRLLAILLSLSLAASVYGAVPSGFASFASEHISPESENTDPSYTDDKTGGSEESGPGETGSGETGSGETGSGETGPGETGPGETGPGETGSGETGSGETGPGETETEGPNSSENSGESLTDPTNSSEDEETEVEENSSDEFGEKEPETDTTNTSTGDDDFDPDKPPYVPGMIKVGLAAQPDLFETSARSGSRQMRSMQDTVEAALDDYSGELLSVLEMGEGVDDIAIIDLPEDMSMAAAIAEYEQSPLVEYAEPIYLYYPMDAALPNDPIYNARLSHHDRINTFEAWTYLNQYHPGPVKPDPVRVAVIDTQIALDHPDLKGNLLTDLAKNYQINSSGQLQDMQLGQPDNEHGSHVAGLIGATANNNIGDVGVAAGYSNNLVEIIPINVFHYFPWVTNPNNPFSASDISIVAGINHALANGARIINLSLGGPSGSNAMRQAVENATKQGVSVIAAAGNDGNTVNPTIATYPSDWPGVISVINVMYNNTSPGSARPGNPGNVTEWRVGVNPRHSSSSYGANKNISAPGNQLWSTVPPGMEGSATPAYPGYRLLNGTSMAAPVVTGVAALMLYANPNLSTTQLAALLYASATDVHTEGFDNHTGHGVVDAQAAVAAVILDNKPATPANVRVMTDGLFDVKITWDIVAGASAYNIYRRLAAADSASAVLLDTVDAGSYIDYSAILGESYIYEVEAFRDTPVGDVVSGRSATAAHGVFVPAPTNFTIVFGGTNERNGLLSWDGVAGATDYVIYRRDISNSLDTAFTLLATVSDTSYLDNSALWNNIYEYKLSVHAPAAGAVPARDGTAVLLSFEYRQNVPINVTAATHNPYAIQLTWQQPDMDVAPSEYRIWRRDDSSSNSSFVRIGQVSATDATFMEYLDRTVKPGVRYSYIVQPAWSNSLNTVPDTQAAVSHSTPVPATMQLSGSAIADDPGAINLTWNTVSGASGYEIALAGASAPVDVGNVAAHKFTGLNPGTSYNVMIRPYWGVGTDKQAGEYSKAIAVQTASGHAPTGLRVVPGSLSLTAVTLTWEAVTGNIGGYRINKDGAPYDFITAVDFNSQKSYTDHRLGPGVSVRYTVQALYGTDENNMIAYGPASSAVTVVSAQKDAANLAPRGLKVDGRRQTAIDVSWLAPAETAANGATIAAYRVYANHLSSDTADARALSHTITGLDPNNTYQIRVVPLWNVADSLVEGRPSVAASAKTHGPAPTNFRTEGSVLGATAITLVWDAVAGDREGRVMGYRINKNDVPIAYVSAPTTQYTDNFLTPGTAQRYTVQACWGDKDDTSNPFGTKPGAASAARKVTAANPAPSGLTLMGAPTEFEARIAWQGVTGADFYDIYFNGVLRYWVSAASPAEERQTGAMYLPSATSSNTTTVTLPMTPGQNVKITVRPVYLITEGESMGRTSGVLSFRVPGGGTPTGFKVMSNKMSQDGVSPSQANAVTPTSIRVQWNSMHGRNAGNMPGRYVLYINGDIFELPAFDLDVGGVEKTFYWFDIQNLDPNTVYNIQVAAMYRNGDELRPGVPSKAAKKRTGGPAPTGLRSNVANNTNVTLTWNAVSDVNVRGYLVVRRDADGTEHFFPTTALSLTDNTLRPGVNARYRVHACWDTESKKPGIARQIQIKPKGKAPGNVRGSTTATSISVTWNALSGEWAVGLDGYRVYLDDGIEPVFKDVGRNTHAVQLGDLLPNSRYRVRVAPIYGSGTDARVGRQSGVRTVRTASGAPKKLRTGSVGQTQAHLTWAAVADNGVRGYVVERTTKGRLEPEVFDILLDDYYQDRNGFVDYNLLPGSEYRYNVRAYWEKEINDTETEKVFGKTSSTLRVRTRSRW